MRSYMKVCFITRDCCRCFSTNVLPNSQGAIPLGTMVRKRAGTSPDLQSEALVKFLELVRSKPAYRLLTFERYRQQLRDQCRNDSAVLQIDDAMVREFLDALRCFNEGEYTMFSVLYRFEALRTLLRLLLIGSSAVLEAVQRDVFVPHLLALLPCMSLPFTTKALCQVLDYVVVLRECKNVHVTGFVEVLEHILLQHALCTRASGLICLIDSFLRISDPTVFVDLLLRKVNLGVDVDITFQHCVLLSYYYATYADCVPTSLLHMTDQRLRKRLYYCDPNERGLLCFALSRYDYDVDPKTSERIRRYLAFPTTNRASFDGHLMQQMVENKT